MQPESLHNAHSVTSPSKLLLTSFPGPTQLSVACTTFVLGESLGTSGLGVSYLSMLNDLSFLCCCCLDLSQSGKKFSVQIQAGK